MDAELEAMLGPLRGRSAPSEAVLLRLRGVSDQFRITWTPPTARRPALWWLHELRAGKHEPARRAAAEARLVRYRKTWSVAASLNPSNEALEFQADDERRGYHYVGQYVEQDFGSDRMFAELEQAQRLVDGQRAEALQRAQDSEDVVKVQEEIDANPEFSQFCRDMAWDYFHHVTARPIVSVPGQKGQYAAQAPDTPSPSHPSGTDESNGKRLQHSGHANPGQPDEHH